MGRAEKQFSGDEVLFLLQNRILNPQLVNVRFDGR
jgi:hypothetical protein